MPPRRCLLSWPGGRTSPHRCSPSWWAGSCVGTAVEPWQVGAWLWPRGCLRQGPCRGPGKGLAAASWASPARVLPGGSHGYPRQGSCRGSSSSDSHLVLYVLGLHKDRRRFPSFGSNVVEGVGTLRLKGGSPAGVGQVAPARFLPGLWRPPRQGPCRGSSPRPSALRVSGLALLWSSCVFASSAPPSVARGVGLQLPTHK